VLLNLVSPGCSPYLRIYVGCLCQLRTADRAAGDLVVADLRAAGLRVWYDRDYISAGDRIREKINERIKKSTSFLLLASRHSLKSRWVLNELDVAMVREIEERRKVVIPMLLGNIAPSDLPGDLRGKNWLDLRRGFAKKYKNCRPSLLRALVVIADGPPKYETVIPIGKESTRYILCYQYLALDEERLLTDEVFLAFAELFLKTPSSLERAHRRKRDFIKECGHWGVRQLLKFFLDHSTVKLTKGFTEAELGALFEQINMSLAARAGNIRPACQGRINRVRVSQTREITCDISNAWRLGHRCSSACSSWFRK
jgi:hypothetical protein